MKNADSNALANDKSTDKQIGLFIWREHWLYELLLKL